ncbi:MAG: transcriptional regulator [Solirubrobacterales bacterium]|nr:transcriptional regulator [Solirubrobacterales bacterium]
MAETLDAREARARVELRDVTRAAGGRSARLELELSSLAVQLNAWSRRLAVVRAQVPAAAPLLREHCPAGAPRRPVLETLDVDRGLLRLGRRDIALTRRHTEIVVLLAAHRTGMTTEELALALYGERGRPATVRTELCRLRKLIGPWLAAVHDRLTVSVDADFLAVRSLLRGGDARQAAEGYPGPLLPRSEAPGVVELREELDTWVRRAAITSEDREALWAWLDTSSGRDDRAALKSFLADLPFDDPRRALAATRLGQLRTTLSIVGDR